jgi:hypothetical protein
MENKNNIGLHMYLRQNTGVTHEQVQVSVNSTGYCSFIYRPVRNYSHALYIYYWLTEKSMRTV